MEKPRLVPKSHRYLTRFISYLIDEATPLSNEPVLFVDRESIETPNATLYHSRYFPESLKDAAMPCILIRTPYAEIVPRLSALRFASHGFCVIIQQCRGREDANSSDEFIPIQCEKEDGLATLNWIASQSFCNGKIGMYGASYLGICLWAVIDQAPSQLKAIIPINCSSNLFPVLSPSGGGVPLDLIVRWIYLVYVAGAKNISTMRKVFRRLQLSRIATEACNHLPVQSIDEYVVGRPLPFYRNSIPYLNDSEHQYWQTEMPVTVCNDVSNAPPTLIIGGWFDLFLNAQLLDWMRLQRSSPVHRLIVGPWHHWQFKKMGPVVESAALEWLQIHLCGDDPAVNAPSRKPVRLFVSGINLWADFDCFPPPCELQKFYLHPNCSLQRSYADSNESLSFVYDPIKDPTPSVGGSSFDSRNAGSLRQNEFESRTDVLLFTTTPLTADLQVVGTVCCKLFVSFTAASSDWVVRICDVDEKNQSMNITDGSTRLLKQNTEPGQVLIEMAAMAHMFKKGHCIRVQVCSGAHPRISRNMGTGVDHLTQPDEYVASTNTLHFFPKMIPHIDLPCLEDTFSE